MRHLRRLHIQLGPIGDEFVQMQRDFEPANLLRHLCLELQTTRILTEEMGAELQNFRRLEVLEVLVEGERPAWTASCRACPSIQRCATCG